MWRSRRLTRVRSAKNVSRETKFSGANGDKEYTIFPVQLTSSRIGNLTRLIHNTKSGLIWFGSVYLVITAGFVAEIKTNNSGYRSDGVMTLHTPRCLRGKQEGQGPVSKIQPGCGG